MAVRKPDKSVLVAYGLLLTLGYFGAHRIYLRRFFSAMVTVALTLLAAFLLWSGYETDVQNRLFAGVLVAAGVISFMVVDLVMVSGMVERWNAREDEHKLSPLSGTLDPSFQATMRQAGRMDDTAEAPRRSSLPEGYERPWHRDASAEPMVYSPSAGTGAAAQSGIPADRVPRGRMIRPDIPKNELGYTVHEPRHRNRRSVEGLRTIDV